MLLAALFRNNKSVNEDRQFKERPVQVVAKDRDIPLSAWDHNSKHPLLVTLELPMCPNQPMIRDGC